jgi:ribosome-binding factor A
MASERRRQRIANVLKEEVARILFREYDVPDEAFVTVTRVDLANDLEHADISISIFPDETAEKTLADLKRTTGLIQKILNRRLRMRPVPKIRFVGETKTGEAARVETELYKLKENH